MKILFRKSEILFAGIAFVSFIVAIMIRILNVPFLFGVTPEGMLMFALGCAVVSINLAVLELAQKA